MASGGTVPHKTDLQKVLECPLCLQQLENPKRLQPCYHSFCEECLKELIPASGEDDQNMRCPVCEISVTQTDISQNTFLNDLISEIKSGDIPPEVKCKQCHGDPNMAVVKCVDCKIELCDNCKISHLKIPTLSDHICVNLKDTSQKVVDRLHFCESHNKPFDFHCADGEKLICSKCIRDHSNHFIELIEATQKCLSEEISQMTKRTWKYCEVLQKNISGIRQKIDEVNKSFENCNTVLEKQLDLLIEKITTVKKRMETEVSQQQENVISMLQETKHILECKLARGEHLHAVASVTLENASSLSLISEIKNGLASSLNNFIHAKTEAPVFFTIPVLQVPKLDENSLETLQELFCKLKNSTSRLNITSHGAVVQFYPVTSFPDVFDGELVRECRIDNLEHSFKLSYINGKLWLPQNQQINVYSVDGTLEKVLTKDEYIWTVKMVDNGHIIFAGEDGLYYRRGEDGESIQITREPVHDIYCCGDMLAALKCRCSSVDIFQLNELFDWDTDDHECQWKLKHSFQLDMCGDGTLDTIQLTEAHLFVYLFGKGKALTYTHAGKLVSEVNFEEDTCPLFCQCDSTGDLLLVSFARGELEIITADWKQVKKRIRSEDINYPWDAVIDSDSNIWVLQGLDSEFCLMKFSTTSQNNLTQ